jgi:hypothetical protein
MRSEAQKLGGKGIVFPWSLRRDLLGAAAQTPWPFGSLVGSTNTRPFHLASSPCPEMTQFERKSKELEGSAASAALRTVFLDYNEEKEKGKKSAQRPLAEQRLFGGA